MTHVELSLIAVVIALLGIGSGKLWSDRKLNGLRKEFSSLHSVQVACHNACKEARTKQEHQLESELEKTKIDIGATLDHLKRDQADVKSELKEQGESLKVLSDSILKITTWFERNGFGPPES